MDVIRVVQRLGLSPDHGECCGDVWCPGSVGELHLITIDGVTEQLSIHRCHTTLDVELTDKPGLNDELSYMIHFHRY